MNPICRDKRVQDSQSRDLVQHKTIYFVENKYACVECDKTFPEAGSFNKHMRVHASARQYKVLHVI